jgi:hypothetical protein
VKRPSDIRRSAFAKASATNNVPFADTCVGHSIPVAVVPKFCKSQIRLANVLIWRARAAIRLTFRRWTRGRGVANTLGICAPDAQLLHCLIVIEIIPAAERGQGQVKKLPRFVIRKGLRQNRRKTDLARSRPSKRVFCSHAVPHIRCNEVPLPDRTPRLHVDRH